MHIEKLYTYCKCPLTVIMGCSCSGKSFIENKLAAHFGNDAYFFPESQFFGAIIDQEIQEETKKTVVPVCAQNIYDFIRDRDGSSYFTDRFRSKCNDALGVEQANTIIEKYNRMLSSEFFANMAAKLIIANSPQKRIVITTHEHTYYDDFLFLKRALEYNFFRMPIYPLFMYVPPEKVVKRLMNRNMKVVNRELPFYDLRLSVDPFLEFFKNLKPAVSGEKVVDSLSLQKMYQILNHTFSHDFPRIASELKIQYPQLISYRFEDFFHKIKLKAFEVVNTFFMNKDIVDVAFIGDQDVYCFTSEKEIEEFIKHFYNL